MKNLWKVLSYVLTAAVAALTVLLFTSPVFRTSGDFKLAQLNKLIDRCFIGEYDQTEMEDAAATAMVNALGDRWSYYIPAADYQSYREQMNNAYVGIGITISVLPDGKGIEIQQVHENAPAGEAGILAGDILIRVGDTDLNGLDVADVKKLVQGPANSEISLTVLRDGKELTFQLNRREIEVMVAEGEMVTDEIGLVKILNFDQRCSEETIQVIEELLDSGASSLIFDVRNNPGGYKKELIEVLDYLLPEGPLFRSEDYRGLSLVDHSDENCLDVPMVVLVNGNSYSAAEFFAAALSEYEAATVVGQQTVGKGYFQQTFQLSDGSAVGLSVGKYFTPKGVGLADVGITPDVEVEVDEDTFASIYAGTLEPDQDPQIQAAIDLLEAA